MLARARDELVGASAEGNFFRCVDFIRRSLGSNELIPPYEVARLEELRASMRAR